MAARDFDAVFYCRELPEIAFEDGHFSVSYDVGKRSRFKFVFAPGKFTAALAQASEVAARWQVDQLDKVKSLKHG